MTRAEFEKEFSKIKTENYENFHSHILENLPSMPRKALYYIVENAHNPFGEWLVRKAMETVFEEMVLDEKSDRGQKRKRSFRGSSV